MDSSWFESKNGVDIICLKREVVFILCKLSVLSKKQKVQKSAAFNDI